MIAFHSVEPDLTPERIDQRLAAGWFPFGQHWMTCRMWPEEAVGAVDTVWIRVALGPTPRSDRHRKLLKQGLTVEHTAPCFDAEHQALYDRFRLTRATWRDGAISGLLLHDFPAGPLFSHTREAALRDGDGQLVAFRWYVQGRAAVAGVTAVYDPDVDGLGSIARYVVDQGAGERGCAWTYPGYVRPGAADPWDYKVKRGRTEWLHPDGGDWISWATPPQPADLDVAELRRRLGPLGPIRIYARWAVPWFDARSSELPTPFYVVTAEGEHRLTIAVWDIQARRLRSLQVVPGMRDGEPTLDVVAAV